MKFGIHLALWMKTWDDDILPYAKKAADIGYDGVEISLLGDVAANAEQVGESIRSLGLEITCTTGLAADTDIASNDPDIRAAGLEKLIESIEITHRLGSKHLSGVIYGAWGVTDSTNRVKRLNWAAEGLKAASIIAEKLDVKLGIEAINRYETDLINTAEQALSLVNAVNSSHVGVHLDSYHMNIEEKDPVTAIKSCGNKLFHYHVVGNDRGVPSASTIDYAKQSAAFKSIGYDDWIVGELFIQAGQAVSDDLTIWRPIESDPDTAAIETLKFLKEEML